MMRISPTAIIRSASPRPYAHAALVSASSFGGSWVCTGHMSTEHNPTVGNTTGSKRLTPGSFVGVLT
jgi:hypothetical protein